MLIVEASEATVPQVSKAMEPRERSLEPQPGLLEILSMLLSLEVGNPVESEIFLTPPESPTMIGVQPLGSAPAGPSMMTAPPPGILKTSITMSSHALVTLNTELAEKLLNFILQL